MTGSKSHISILILNINWLNALLKRHIMATWIKRIPNHLLSSTDPSHKWWHPQAKSKVLECWSKTYHTNTKQKTTQVTILISDKIDFKPVKIKKDEGGHYIIIEGTTQQEDLTILHIYTPDTGGPRLIKHILLGLWKDLNNHTIVVGDFNTPLTALDRSSRQNTNKQTLDLNSMLDQWNIADIPEHSTQQPLNIHSSNLHVKHILRLITCLVIKQVSIN